MMKKSFHKLVLGVVGLSALSWSAVGAAAGPLGRNIRMMHEHGIGGCYSEVVKVPAQCVMPIPDDVSFDDAVLLRNTSVINMLDGCAISIPCHAPGELPVGLMLWHGALHDDAILGLALQAESVLSPSR